MKHQKDLSLWLAGLLTCGFFAAPAYGQAAALAAVTAEAPEQAFSAHIAAETAEDQKKNQSSLKSEDQLSQQVARGKEKEENGGKDTTRNISWPQEIETDDAAESEAAAQNVQRRSLPGTAENKEGNVNSLRKKIQNLFPMGGRQTSPIGGILHPFPVYRWDEGGTLLFSDSPEYPDKSGILYQDTVTGKARILYYHVNCLKVPAKVAVVLENTNQETILVNVTRGGSCTPSTDYMTVGKAAQAEYFAREQHLSRIYIRPGERRLLTGRMDTTVLQVGDLVTGIYDFNSYRPVKVSVIIYPADKNPYEFMNENPAILPRDQVALRGTFQGMDRFIKGKRSYDPDKDGPMYVTFVDSSTDADKKGIDATDGTPAVNHGNYGVLYHIDIPVTGRSSVSYRLCPGGGVYAGAMRVYLSGDRMRELFTPENRTYFGDGPFALDVGSSGEASYNDGGDYADLGIYTAADAPSFEYSPPGASNLPAYLVMSHG